ncbi:TRAP transporter large permease [Leucobacter aridicollis]|uniref:TRAP transporter large permease n=1 Tax=Leucobacter aridicollis TaxID=283878 RepID=UPI0021084BA3|nr:TRAP transporter large permease [Leucobacter aridicollis]UTX54339.1 TRAP transporter large permease [Leucobacter aridicollis]
MLEIVVPLLLLLALMALGVPVAFSMLLAGVVGMLFVSDFGLVEGLLAITPQAVTSTFTYSVIPLFILMAEFLSGSTIASRLFDTARAWTGRIPGGLAASTIGAGAAMGTISGSSLATTSTLARVAVPEMRKAGYSDKLSVSSAASGGVLAAMIPPSILLLMYGVTTETSISQLFAAGILPAILQAILFIVLIVVWVKVKPGTAPASAATSWSEKFRSLTSTFPALLLIILVLGGIYSGIVTVLEAGAIGAFGALIVGVVFGGLRWKAIREALQRAVETTASIFLVIIGAKIFAQYVTLTGITQSLTRVIADAGLAPLLVLMFVILVYLILGMFMDAIGAMLLTLPIFFPLITSLGYDGIWFGIIVVLMIEIGLLTPPLGLNVFVATSVTKADLRDVFGGSMWFVLISLVTVAIVIAVPQIATLLPSLAP